MHNSPHSLELWLPTGNARELLAKYSFEHQGLWVTDNHYNQSFFYAKLGEVVKYLIAITPDTEKIPSIRLQELTHIPPNLAHFREAKAKLTSLREEMEKQINILPNN